jgi:hypothetical protein
MTPNGQTFAQEGFIALINGSTRILESNFEGNSAVIHVIDTVLLPEYKAASIGVDSGLPVRNETANGLNTTAFDTLEGTVTVNLPDDLAAGDTISGTVISEPKGKTGDEQAKNQDELSGYVVEVAQPETPMEKDGGNLAGLCTNEDPAPTTNDYSLTVCKKWPIPDTVSKIPIVLKNKEGKIVGRTEVPVGPKESIAKVENCVRNISIPAEIFHTGGRTSRQTYFRKRSV